MIFQSGVSEEGRDLAARSPRVSSPPASRFEPGTVLPDIKARAAALGRNPDHSSSSRGSPVRRRDRRAGPGPFAGDLRGDNDFDRKLAFLGRVPGTTSAARPRCPVPDVPLSERLRAQAEKLVSWPGTTAGPCARPSSIAARYKPMPFVGSPATVAGVMQNWFDSAPWTASTSPSGSVPPVHRRGRADPAGARPVPHRVRGRHAAGTWASRCRRTGTPPPAGPPNASRKGFCCVN